MRKYRQYILSIIFLLLIPIYLYATDGVSTVEHPAKVNSVATPDKVCGVSGLAAAGGYTDIDFYWGAQDETAEKSAGDSSVTLGSGAVIDTGFGQVGGKSCDFPGADDKADFDISSADIVDHLSGVVGFYVYFDTVLAGTKIFQCTYDDNNKIQFYLSDVWYLQYRGSSSGTNRTMYVDWSPSTTTWYFVEVIWGGATYTLQVKVGGNNVSNTTDVLPIMTNTPTLLTWGTTASVASDLHMDQMLSSADPARDLYAIRDQTSFPD